MATVVASIARTTHSSHRRCGTTHSHSRCGNRGQPAAPRQPSSSIGNRGHHPGAPPTTSCLRLVDDFYDDLEGCLIDLGLIDDYRIDDCADSYLIDDCFIDSEAGED